MPPLVEAVQYRVAQFLRALTAPYAISEDRAEQAMALLTPEAQELFRRQSPQDQHHALAVYETLRHAGHKDPHLLSAALLHDMGKARCKSPAYMRAVFVLLERFAPRLLTRLIEGERKGWRRAFIDYANHPDIGASWAEEIGCSPLTVALIRRHQEYLPDCQTKEDRLLKALQAADGMN